VKLRDGAEIALDIALPPAETQSTAAAGADLPPVVLMIHGAIQGSTSATMVSPAQHFASLGAPAVVMNRRGYAGLELNKPRMSVFGFDDDLDDVLAVVEKRFPGRLVALLGFSAGSMYAARWAARRASLSAWHGGPLLCTVLLDCGFDPDPDQESPVQFPYSVACALGMKYQYGIRHRRSFARSPSGVRQKSVDQVIFSPKLESTYKASAGLAGGEVGSSVDAWHAYSQADFTALPFPTLVIQSRDDPICAVRNLERYRHRLMQSPNVCLVEFEAGSHGCKFPFGGGESAANRLVSDFIIAAAEEWRRQLDSGVSGRD
jgi:pimeloyl-ACP methyl ester carboxylesterase